jgi:hypothetical protein
VPAVGPGVAAQAAPWREAVEALVRELATPGQPWSCPGGRVDLMSRDGRATLVVGTDDGRTIAREVDTPDEVLPLGQALFAQPIPTPPPPPPAPSLSPSPAPAVSPSPSPSLSLSPSPPPDAPPRALVSLTLGARVAGPSPLLLGTASLTAVVPFAGFTAGAFARVDAPSAALDGAPGSMTGVGLGLTAGRAFPIGQRFELRASLLPSLAFVTAGKPTDESRLDGRIGAELRGALTLSRLFRGVVALDADLAPRELGGGGAATKTRDDDAREHEGPVQRFPAYTVGLGLGVEVTPR